MKIPGRAWGCTEFPQRAAITAPQSKKLSSHNSRVTRWLEITSSSFPPFLPPEMSDVYLDGYSSTDPNVLFNDSLVKKLDYSKCSCQTLHGLSYHNPGTKDGRRLIIRPLERTDFFKGYLALLSQLTEVGEYGVEKFEFQFDRMKNMAGCHYILVVEDPGCDGLKSRVIASASLIVECKLIHGAKLRGRIEDVVVDARYRGMHLGSLLLETLGLFSEALECYKITLDCKEAVLPYYTKLGYKDEGQHFLTQRFSD